MKEINIKSSTIEQSIDLANLARIDLKVEKGSFIQNSLVWKTRYSSL